MRVVRADNAKNYVGFMIECIGKGIYPHFSSPYSPRYIHGHIKGFETSEDVRDDALYLDLWARIEFRGYSGHAKVIDDEVIKRFS